MRKTGFLSFIIFSAFSILSTANKVLADDEGGFGGEIGQGLGSAAVGLLGIGAIYVVIRRGVLLYTTWDGAEPELRKQIRRTYARFKTPLLHVHQISLVIATILAVIHGIMVGSEGRLTFVSGWIAATAMILSSISGFFLWQKMKPTIKGIKLFLPIRIFHRQWILTFILGIFLLIHVA